MTGHTDWVDFWNSKAGEGTDFQATGRRRMDVVGFLYTVHECVRALQLGASDRFLDIGCGTGIIALAVSAFVRSVHAVDISPAMVERARQNLSDVPNARVDCGSIVDLPAESGCADKALAYSVLQYLSGEDAVRRAFQEVARVLRPGGRALLAANPDPKRFDAYMDFYCGNDPVAREREVAFQRNLLWLDPPIVCEMAEAVGLSATIETPHGRIQQSFYMYDLLVVRR